MMAATGIGFGPDIESIGMVRINPGFCSFKRITEDAMQFIEESSAENKSHKSEVKMADKPPGCEVAGTALGNEAVNMRVPLQIAPESMKDKDETGSKVFGLIDLIEHAEDNAGNRVKETVEKRTVFKKKRYEVLQGW